MRKLTTFLLLLAMLIPTAGAQSTDIFKKKKKKNSKDGSCRQSESRLHSEAKKSPFQPYASVITGKAKTMNGFFKVQLYRRKILLRNPRFPVWTGYSDCQPYCKGPGGQTKT